MNKKKVIKYVCDIKDFAYVLSWSINKSWSVSRIYTILRITIEIINPVLVITGTFISKLLIDTISDSSKVQSDRQIHILLIVLMVIALIRVILGKIQNYTSVVHTEQLERWMQTQSIDFSLNVDLECFDDPVHQDKINSAIRDGSILIQTLRTSISTISSIIFFIIAFILLSRENIVYALAILFVSIPSGIAQKYYTNALYNLSINQTLKRRKLSYIQSIASDRRFSQDVRLFGSNDFFIKQYNTIWSDIVEEHRNILKKRSKNTFLLDYIPELTLIVISGNIIFRIIRGDFTIGDYVFLSGLMSQLWFSTSSFISSAMEIIENRLRMDNYEFLLNYQNRVSDKGKCILTQISSIEFKNVSFKYPQSDNYVLKEISFIIEAPECVAFVGVNGSGKSTIIKLLLRFYEATSGSILINKIDICNYKIESLRRQFSAYFQDMANFSFSIKTNFQISEMDSNVSEDKIIDALGMSDFLDLLDLGNENLDTYVSKAFSSKGVILSGGQLQKLALARTLFRKSSVIILDEVSSNLDPESENHIFTNLSDISKDKLIIFTSHRLSNISLAKRVIVLEDGIIIEDGEPQKLSKDNKRYAELLRFQQNKYQV